MQTNIGKELRRLRREADLTLEDIGKATGFSLVYISQIERGERPVPSTQMLEKFVEKIGKPELFLQLYRLNVSSRKEILINLENKTDAETELFASLARESETEGISPELVAEINKLLLRSREAKK